MSEVPAYLKGRGRGRGNAPTSAPAPAPGAVGKGWGSQLWGGDNAGNNKTKGYGQMNHNATNGFQDQKGNGVVKKQASNGKRKESSTVKRNGSREESAGGDEKFRQASVQHQQAIQQYLQDQPQSNENDSSEDEDDIGNNILSSVFKSYSSSIGEDEKDINRAQDDLVHSFRSGVSACLVCIETIKKNEAIWNCSGCCAMFHMQCIQKWVKEGVYQHMYRSQDDKVPKDLPWFCPKCRLEYKPYECPTRYMCFCGKVEDPKFDPWLVPHSCGQTCGRQLKPECGHTCLLLCHPGPCPPCPKTVRTKCYCGKQGPAVRRCSAKTWSCGQPCGRTLSCGQHKCQQPCHVGECAPCPKTSEQKCQCGKSTSVQPCATPQWQCTQVCGKRLSCGSHVCERSCHGGSCGLCPRAGARTCPCGKTEYTLPCTDDVPTCGDTCGKILDCGIHKCSQRCHLGPCGTCRQMIKKKCRCGLKQKEIPCYKEYMCDTKCSNTKDCGRHQCKRKCCDSNCPSCEQTCSKPLGCKNHKCSSRCHKGACYPCPLTVEITCFCKATRITVPCGREKFTKPPRCKQSCRLPPKCHHPEQVPHRCHFGDCPPCRLMCAKVRECGHICSVGCHTAIKVKVKDNVQRAGPWEGRPIVRDEIVEKMCPPCLVPVPVTCLGGHETCNIPCYKAKPESCQRPCGRQLSCGNHTCSLSCHQVQGAADNIQAGENCEVCESHCLKPRPEGCSHDCALLKCHPGPCPSCQQMNRMRCHCELTVQHINCDKWLKADQVTKDALKSCKGACPKTMPCGHVCGATCHAGQCPRIGLCEKKINMRCKCRNRKQELVCKNVPDRQAKLECNEACKVEKEKKKKEEEEKEKSKLEEERLRNQAEIEEYEKKMKGGKKRKPRKQQDIMVQQTFVQKYGKYIAVSVVIGVLAVFAYHLLQV
ncbi:NF-X1-type zinc finger protein NFXL1-like [Ylistrum balloti]|uniref:NF-X1-type zinc finger protein NFXL1-like n=1 Tax=Ylistrum balloti TaxID=509963 RepID=UPI0029057F9B|nr:NF-X1-type zinc finger protein NFXL1-like [Ylistrum balloti]